MKKTDHHYQMEIFFFFFLVLVAFPAPIAADAFGMDIYEYIKPDYSKVTGEGTSEQDPFFL